MAEYLILLYENEAEYLNADQSVWDSVMADHQKFGADNEAALRGGNALQPTTTATTIRRDGDDLAVTDGPFAETKEALGGYYLIEAPDLDAAIEIAKQCPARFGGVEVRPIMVF